MKKLILLSLILSLFCISAYAADDFAWSIDDGVLTITGSGAMPDYTQFWDYAPWYESRDSITSIVIGEGITYIGELAFYNCQKYSSVTIPASVTSIASTAFQYCQSFTTINVSDDNPAFKVVDGILFSKDGTTIVKCPEGMMTYAYTVPDGVKHIGANAFENCWNMPSITIPESVESFGESAFALCSKLTAVNIPSGITEIPDLCFGYCQKLERIDLPSGVTSIGDEAFFSCGTLANITFPDSLTSIGNSAFAYCYGFNSIIIPKNVEGIGGGAFRVCTGVNEYTLDAENTSFKVVEGVLFSADMTTLVSYPAGKTDTEYTIPSTVETVFHSAFCENKNLTAITLSPNTVIIGQTAFYRCLISTIVLPQTVKHVDYSAFNNCEALASITVYSLDAEYEYGVFDGTAENLVFTCYKGSTVDTYALDNGHSVEYIGSDIDCDGTTTVKDAIIALKALLNGEYIEAADTDKNNKLDLIDILRVLKIAVA